MNGEVEHWLRETVMPTYDAMQDDPQRGLSVDEVTAALVAHTSRRGGRWEARIKAALEEAKSDHAGIPHRQVEDWMESWDTERELPKPENARRRKPPGGRP